MTRLTTLIGTTSSPDYTSQTFYPPLAQAIGTTASVINEDTLIPFSVRKTVTVDKVAWWRDNTTAGNAYVGIYNTAGTLLTDCAVDSNTTVGLHAVDTTNVTLLPGRIYYLSANLSVDIAATVDGTPAGGMTQLDVFGANLGLGVAPVASTSLTVFAAKARSNAALPSTQTMSGWTGTRYAPYMGWISA